ncbi:SIR2 family protein [Paraburkholderia sp. MM5482-R1]|uniref:SIR2 family protein n=1 Tax=unclassified Paraburkholderia TaxID=2615204 RepID=UPI003D1A0A47
MTATGLPEDLYFRIQAIFRGTPLLLLGSGFSCAYDLPNMGALGEHLANVVGARLTTEHAKSVWAASLSAVRANLEAGLNTIPNGAQGRDEIVAVLREETANLIIERTLAAEKSILAHTRPEQLAPARLLRRLYDGAPQNADSISVVTTNYDTLVELFCDLACIPIDTGFSGFRRRKPRSSPLFQTQYYRSVTVGKKGAELEHRPLLTLRLYKPHGSITWNTTESGPIEVTNDYSMATRAIVVPGPSKYQDALVNTLFDAMRTEMNGVLNRSSALLCMGFGFNDDHLQGVIKARLDAHMPTLILTRGLTDNLREVIRRYPHVIVFCKQGTGSECHYDGQVLTSPVPVWQLEDFLEAFIE